MADDELELLKKIHSTLLDIKRGIAAIEDSTSETAGEVAGLKEAIGQLSGQIALGNLPSGRPKKMLRPE